jgi:hypothetical protein
LAGRNFRRTRFPPSRLVCSVMETNSPELPRVLENERSILLSQNKVIVLLGSKIRRFQPEIPTHSKVNSDPIVAGKDKEHLLPARG